MAAMDTEERKQAPGTSPEELLCVQAYTRVHVKGWIRMSMFIVKHKKKT